MNTVKDPHALNDLLRDYGDSGLRKIVRQAQRLLALEPLLDQYLPQNLRPHCRLAHTTATEWVIIVDAAAWAMHLRYLKPKLLQQLKQHPSCAYLKEIQFKIQPSQLAAEKTEPPPPPRSLSAENKEILRTTAEMVTDPALKQALSRLIAFSRPR